MFRNNIQDIKCKKAFHKKDLICYGILLLAIIFLFTIFFPFGEKSKGFYLFVENKKIFTFNYDKNYKKENNFAYEIDVNFNENKIIVYFNIEKTEYNVISFNCENKSVYVSDSTCSVSKDCVYSKKITNTSGVIYCAPHKLKILPMGSNNKIDPVIG